MKKKCNIITRWRAKTPKLFKKIIRLALSISGLAVAIHGALASAGAAPPEWWNIIYPYLIGVPAGMASVAKITQTYDKEGNPIYEDKEGDEK